ncbi:DUF423 domain-containing protein [Candidatus Neomarinimicrobiota bacterium]
MNWIVCGAFLAMLGVALGAFGSHGLRDRVDGDLIMVFETGVRYQMYHALAILIVGLGQKVLTASKWLSLVPWLFLVGIVIFSGSLYLLVLLDKRWLGALTPLGGLAMIAGWIALMLAVWQEY